jgi:hypothetical protein
MTHVVCKNRFYHEFNRDPGDFGYIFKTRVGRVAQSVQQLATGWTVRGSNPGGGEIFRTCPDRLWGPPSLLYNGYPVFPGG